MLTVATVHTSGINWESIGVLAATIVASFFTAAAYISNRIDRNRVTTERLIEAKAKDIIDAVTDKHLEDYRHKRRRR